MAQEVTGTRSWRAGGENNSIQAFDLDGHFWTEWMGLLRPDALCFDTHHDVVYVGELTHMVSIYALGGEKIAQWGGAPLDQNAKINDNIPN